MLDDELSFLSENSKKPFKRFIFTPPNNKKVTISYKFARVNPTTESLDFDELLKQSVLEGKLILYNYLKSRPRSIFECSTRLSKEGFIREEITLIIDDLKSQRLLDDVIFTEFLIQGYQKSGRPLGELALKSKLKEKGIAEVIYSPLLKEYFEENEEEFIKDAITLLKKNAYRFEKTLNEYEKNKKMYAYLYNRGFKSRTIEKILKRY